MREAPTPPATYDAAARIAALETALCAERVAREKSEARANTLAKEVEKLREAHARLREELELLRRRIFVAKAERMDTNQLELEFARKLADLNALAKDLPADFTLMPDGGGEPCDPGAKAPKPKNKPKGRRNLADANLPEKRCEIRDPIFEELVAQGEAVQVGFELSYKIGWERGGARKVVIARATYRVKDVGGETSFERAPKPVETFERSLAAPSFDAHVVYSKFALGLPLYRLENELRHVIGVDRGTMSRWLEDAGATVGATIIEAARAEALATAFCISTDATGVAVQPPPQQDKRRQPCARGHFFIQIADRDHVFVEYTPKETSAAVANMFKGFSGYVQADAKSVFDILYRPPPDPDNDDDGEASMKEVGCFAHCRRKFWEAAVVLKDPTAREAVYRIGRFYEMERKWRGRAASEITALRNAHLRPEIEAFFEWVKGHYEIEKHRRGLLRKALGYADRQQAALMRFLDDGRLCIDNNASERGLKPIALGRKAWLFVGSDDHGSSTGHLMSLIASARLHGLDVEQYLRDVFRVLGHWPSDRYIELSAKYWAITRARLNPAQLAAEYGPLDVPERLPPLEQQPVSR